jgi:hypothetical protein
MTGRGTFTGRCYLCGEHCGHTYCHEHKWCAAHLSVPYRRDIIAAPTLQEFAHLTEELTLAERTIRNQERKLQAWRETSARRLRIVA